MATRTQRSTATPAPQREQRSTATPASRREQRSTTTPAPRREQRSTATPAPRRESTNLPAYEAPTYSLNPAAQRAIAQLAQIPSLRKLSENLDEARSALSVAAGEVNDRLSDGNRLAKKRKENERSEQLGSQDGDNDAVEKSLDELKDKVERMTQRMDASIRKMIDGQHSIEFMKSSIAAVAEEARTNASTQASTQNMRSRATRRDADDESEDEAYQDPTPTDPTSGTPAEHTPIEAFRLGMENATTRYQSHSLLARYAENNEYREFRRVVHDAQHHDDDVPMPHHREWFNEGEAPAPGVTTRTRAHADEDDDDDDIAIARATTSTKCPLTLQEFQQPLSSKKCPHSFEAEAIISMIRTNRVGAHRGPRGGLVGGVPGVKCPVPGCTEDLTRDDLHTDAALVRKIRRIQKAKRLAEEDEDGDENQRSTRRAQMVDDDDDEEDEEDQEGDADVTGIITGKVASQRTPGRQDTHGSAHPTSLNPKRTEFMNLKRDHGGEIEDDDDDAM